MARPKSEISEKLSWASVALANAVEAEIAAALAVYGINAETIARDKALQQRASEAVSRQVAAAGALRAASARVKKADKAARVAYQDLAKVARSAFKRQPEALATLGLTTSMPAAQPPFITMGLALFDNAMSTPSLAEALLGYGFTTERLGSLRGKIVALIEERRLYGLANGASQQATTEQNQAMAALADEMSSLRTIAKVALRDKPQLLEKLGIVQRTTRTAAQRGAGKKAAATRKTRRRLLPPDPPSCEDFPAGRRPHGARRFSLAGRQSRSERRSRASSVQEVASPPGLTPIRGARPLSPSARPLGQAEQCQH